MTDQQTAPKPSGRDEVRTALIAAANELFGWKGPDAFTVRDVAKHANVNHALLHRHFGSKEQLLKDLMAEHALNFIASSKDADSPVAALDAMFDLMATNPAFVRIIAHLLLNGHPPEEFVSEHGGSQRLVEIFLGQIDGDREDAQLLAAMSTAFTMGWLFFEPFVLRAVGFEGNDEDARSRVRQHIERMLPFDVQDR